VEHEGRPRTHDGVAIVTRGDLLLVLYNEPARLARTRWAFDVADEFAAANPEGIVALMVVTATADPPDGPTRAENTARFRRIGPSLRRFVTVPVGDELRMMIVRTIMRGISILQGQLGTHVIEGSIDLGIARIRERASGRTPAHKTIQDDLRSLFAALDATPPQ
jgi:hypothetical protein